jgi:hypothetical protein
MPIVIPIRLSGEQAEAELKKFQDEWKAKFGVELELETGKAKEGLEDVKDKANELNETVKGIAFRDVMQAAVGSIGNVKDILEKTGGALFGFSDATVATIGSVGTLAEKGASLGGELGALLGPLGRLVGTGVGAVGGGILGYFVGNSEAAEAATEELNRQIAEQEKRVQRLITVWAQADAAKRGAADLKEGWYGLRDAINATIDAEDLSKASKEDLNRRAKESEAILKSAYDGIGAKAAEVANLETELARVKTKHYTDAYQALADTRLIEIALGKASEEYAAVQANVNAQLTEYNNVTSELASRKSAIKQVGDAASDSTEEVKKLAEAMIWLNKAMAETEERAPRRELERQPLDRTIAEVGLTRGAGAQGGRGMVTGAPDAEEAKIREMAYQQDIDMYAAYVSQISSITGELTATLEANIASGNNLFSGMGAAAERGVSQVLKALGKMWAAQAIGEIAAGIAALANPAAAALKGETAAGHFLAAAKFGAAAVAASVGGAVLGGDASRRDNARNENGGGSGDGYSTQSSYGNSNNRFNDPGPQQLATVIYMGGGSGSTVIYAGSGEDAKARAGAWVEDVRESAANAGPRLKGGG